ncbi:MAG: TetR/AcrR family transcriptional regulator [Pirellulaceae bacterium]
MSEDMRTRILNAAGPIFAEKGFQAATVREICDAAGANVASVNYYFGDKEQLYIETVKRARQLKAARVPLPKFDTSTSPEACLRDYIKALLTRMIGVPEAPWQPRLMMREMLQPTKACQEVVEEYIQPDFNLLLEILTALLPDETPPHVRRQVGFSIVGQCLFYRVAGDVVAMLVPDGELEQHYSVDRLAEHVSQMTLSALNKSPEPAAG